MTLMRSAVASMVALALALPCLGAEDAASCPDGDAYLDCMAKSGDKMAVYVQGREAYEAARDTHDYSRALKIARDLDREHDKNGERLLKMVHLQLGWGGHKDLVQAYAWLSEDLAAGKDYVGVLRRGLVEKMSPEQLKVAREKAPE